MLTNEMKGAIVSNKVEDFGVMSRLSWPVGTGPTSLNHRLELGNV